MQQTYLSKNLPNHSLISSTKKCTIKKKNFVILSASKPTAPLSSPQQSKNESTRGSNQEDELKSSSSDTSSTRVGLKRKLKFSQKDNEIAHLLIKIKRARRIPFFIPTTSVSPPMEEEEKQETKQEPQILNSQQQVRLPNIAENESLFSAFKQMQNFHEAPQLMNFDLPRQLLPQAPHNYQQENNSNRLLGSLQQQLEYQPLNLGFNASAQLGQNTINQNSYQYNSQFYTRYSQPSQVTPCFSNQMM